MTPRATTHPGFTLIELLMTLTIITAIISLMLPAIKSSREASRQVACLNNLRQLGLALQNYEYVNTVLPPGSVALTGPIRNRADNPALSWLVQLLPYIEQNGVYQAINTSASPYDPVNATALNVRINSFHCPSEPQSSPAWSMGVTTYAGCHHDVEAAIDVDNHGVLYLNSSVRRDDVTDGTSFTIFVGEKRLDPSDLGWMSGTRATLRNTGAPINADAAQPTPGSVLVGGFASHHPGGATFLLGDGSVRYLRSSIAPGVLRSLGNRADGEMIGDDQF